MSAGVSEMYLQRESRAEGDSIEAHPAIAEGTGNEPQSPQREITYSQKTCMT